ncbi:MAG: tetratricopeptide repeat protein, partial [Kiritimatiellae bacterium]|nr:tetratricopeptide repeat protein [Kiritimatiellia bacterium]
MMKLETIAIAGCLALAVSPLAQQRLFAQEEPAEAEEAETAEEPEEEEEEPATPVDEALEAEIAYVEALIEFGFPDFAEPVIAATKKKWPESEARFFAIEIRGMLSLGKFDEAESRIAALPDRSSSKYWAARLEVANNYVARGMKKECADIYEEFFQVFPEAPSEIRGFYLDACYAWGQILVSDKRFDDAVQVYENLLKQIDKTRGDDEENAWCNVAAQTAEMYLRLAGETADQAALGRYLAGAKRIVDLLLWEIDQPVFFGRAIAMKANIELLKGDVAKAQATIDEYMGQLADIHDQLTKNDPDGKLGLIKLSPMPLCRYMLAEMLWKGVAAEIAAAEKEKRKRSDDKIKALMFGEKKPNGKRNKAGAYNHAINVFVKYPRSPWAFAAGELAEKIKAFAQTEYGATVDTPITPEQLKEIRAMQFQSANEKLVGGLYEEAIADYYEALARFPEAVPESVMAIENMIGAYMKLLRTDGENPKAAAWRMDMDAVEGYLAERFAGSSDKALMSQAGDAVLRVAAAEKQAGQLTRADRLYHDFMINYRNHVNAAPTAATMASEAQNAEKWSDALAIWKILGKYYPKSPFYASSVYNVSYCLGKLDNREGQIKAMKKYVDIEKSPLKREQARMSLAQLYQKEGFDVISAAETNETAEAVSKQLAEGSAQIIRGIKEFRSFAEEADRALGDPGVTAADKAKYSKLKEQALYLIGDCWRRLTKPEAKIDEFRRNAAASFEEYLQAYPEGMFSTNAYVRLGTIYTALGDVEKSRDALDRLSRRFPDSREAKNAKPQLAKRLIEMGLKKEGTEIYAEMLKTDGAYTAGQFVNAGEALIEAKSWDLAHRAFEKAIAKAGTNQMTTVARARIGEARALYRQKNLVDAREAIDIFLADDKMAKMSMAADAYLLMVEVASEQGRTEKDDKLRDGHFGAAVGAVKKLRNYWKKSRKPHEVDSIDIMSAEVVIDRMRAEESMGLKEKAQESCARAAAMLQSFLQSHGPTEEVPADKMSAGELENLERCYSRMVPLFAKMGDEQADRVMLFGREYLDLFPNGKSRTEIQNCINQAKASCAAEVETSLSKRKAQLAEIAAEAASETESGPEEAPGETASDTDETE